MTDVVTRCQQLQRVLQNCSKLTSAEDILLANIKNFLHDQIPTPGMMLDVFSRLPIDDQVMFVKGLIRHDYKVVDMPWLELWMLKNAVHIAKLKVL